MEGENWLFNPKKEDWDSYIGRLELYMEMKNVADNKKTDNLLTKVEMDMYKRIRDLCALEKRKIKVTTT